MQEIKTITEQTASAFDATVNKAIADGWALNRRECFITGSDRATTFYAELERFTYDDEDEKEEEAEDNVGVWLISRDPLYPFKCSACGCKSHQAIVNCPYCHRIMEMGEE